MLSLNLLGMENAISLRDTERTEKEWVRLGQFLDYDYLVFENLDYLIGIW